jgi:hypothetical protein
VAGQAIEPDGVFAESHKMKGSVNPEAGRKGELVNVNALEKHALLTLPPRSPQSRKPELRHLNRIELEDGVMWFHAPNENKLSHRWRERAVLRS